VSAWWLVTVSVLWAIVAGLLWWRGNVWRDLARGAADGWLTARATIAYRTRNMEPR